MADPEKAVTLGRSLKKNGWASAFETLGPVRRFGTYLGSDVDSEVLWRLTCWTTTEHRPALESFAKRVINRAGVEFTITPLIPDRPTDS
jgi:hypothetical protein